MTDIGCGTQSNAALYVSFCLAETGVHSGDFAGNIYIISFQLKTKLNFFSELLNKYYENEPIP